MESKKQTIVAILALIVSTLSLVVSIFVARSQYQENIEVVAGPCYISDMDLESGIINGQAEVIVANTSYSTTSILRSEVFSSQFGFNPDKQSDSSLRAELPITLIQGGAEKISFSFRSLLDDENPHIWKSSSTWWMKCAILRKRWLLRSTNYWDQNYI